MGGNREQFSAAALESDSPPPSSVPIAYPVVQGQFAVAEHPRQGVLHEIRASVHELALAERVVFFSSLGSGFIAFLLACAYTGVVAPVGTDEQLAWIARCYRDDFNNSMDPPEAGPFAWDDVTEEEIRDTPPQTDAKTSYNLLVAAMVFLLMAYVAITVIGRCQCDGARCCSCGQGKSLGSCLALTAGTILTALSCGGFSLGILVLGYYKDCDGRAWNSFASGDNGDNVERNSPISVPSSSMGFVATMALAAVAFSAAYVILSKLYGLQKPPALAVEGPGTVAYVHGVPRAVPYPQEGQTQTMRDASGYA